MIPVKGKVLLFLMVVVVVLSAFTLQMVTRVNALEDALEDLAFKHSMARIELDSLYAARYRLEDTLQANGMELYGK